MIAAVLLLAVEGATALTIPFAPPEGVALKLEIVQTRNAPSASMRFRLAYEIIFARDGDGWTMTATLDDLTADAPPRSAEVFEAGKQPFVGTPMVVRLDRAGRILAIDEEDGHWGRFRAGQDAVAAIVQRSADVASTDRRAIAAVTAGVLEAPPEVRRRHLLADIEPLVAQAGRTAESGAPIAFSGATGGATGTLVLERNDGAVARFVARSRTAPDALAQVTDDREIDVHVTTGLTRREVRVRSIGQGGVDSLAREERTLSGMR